MKIKSLMYKDDGKVETTLRFGDNLALVVSAPVRVAIEGDTSGLAEEEVDKLCRELERGIARELDFRLFELCVEIIQVAGSVEMMAAQAVAKEQLSFRDVERLCERHLARRSLAGIGYRLVRYERSESQHFRCAYSWVSDYLLERIDFDRAFRQLSRRSQKVLIAWYGMEQWTQQQIADWLGVTPRTVRRWRVHAIEELRDILNS